MQTQLLHFSFSDLLSKCRSMLRKTTTKSLQVIKNKSSKLSKSEIRFQNNLSLCLFHRRMLDQTESITRHHRLKGQEKDKRGGRKEDA